MTLRFAWAAPALLVAMGCGGAFTTTLDSKDDGGAGTGTSTGSAGTSATGGGGDVGEGGSTGTSGSNSGAGGSSSGIGGSSAGSAGSVGTGGSMGTGGSGGQGPDWTACDGPGQCVALETSCCGSCGSAELAAYAGVNTKRVQDFHSQTCPVPVACPAIACPQQPMNPNIAARCVAGHCQAFDVRKVAEYSACDGDTDCHLRAGLGCCVCGGSNAGWVAINKSGEQGIANAECAPNTGCAECIPVPPARTLASCSSHVCQVLLAP